MLNIIAVDRTDKNISTSNLHIFDMIELLEKEYGYKTVDISILKLKGVNNVLIQKFKKLPDNILIIKGSSEIFKFKVSTKIKLSFFIDDVHPGGKVRRNREKSLQKVTNVFSTYAYAFNKYYIEGNYNLYWLPHSIRFTNIKLNKNPIHKILITGRLYEKVYPNRQKIYNMSLNNTNIYYLKPNVGYRVMEDKVTDNLIFGSKFMNFINRFFCGFTCDLIPERPYIVAKHFEIMGSGALLLACNPNTKSKFEELGFIDGQHYISCNPENLEEKINYILNKDNYNELNKIRKNGYEFTLKNHNYKIRTKFLHDKLTS